ncbi:peptidoglycan-binding protein [Actinoplanes sp. NPDC051494]|uniref:peptidoglycan-binding protein n=1 Tax=Actinoplanes sp. NPDC051494 TaxID=3363907 RepID=UPI003787F7E6
MSARGMLSVVGTAVGGLIGWSDDPAPAADPAVLRDLFATLGLPVGRQDEDLTDAVRGFQEYAGLEPDGVAGPRTVHVLARYVQDLQDLRTFEHSVAA